tara:strand:- start:7612 stop:8523 length:912 start_codon:yes stop_codon:yes gene_type:complete
MKYGYSALIAILLLGACARPTNKSTSNKVVCTTGIIADAVEELLRGQDSISVNALMGPGVDPHLYKASQGDIKKLMEADLIIYNGLHLEGKMNELFEKMQQHNKLAAAEAIPKERLINSSNFASAYDPHVWFDLKLWSIAVAAMADKLKEQYPALASKLEDNKKRYLKEINTLHEYVGKMVIQVPEKQRVLITAHDAFEYFGRQYGFEVRGLQGISTSSEYGIRDVSNLAQYVNGQGIKAIFIESSIPKRAIEAVQAAVQELGGSVNLGGELYSDALGAAEGEAGTYLGMVRTNTNTIVEALK